MREELTWVLNTENRSRQDLRETERGVERVDKRTKEMNRSWSRFQNMVGGVAVGAGLARFGRHVQQVTGTIRDQRRETQNLLDISKENLDAVQSRTRAIAQVYDADYGDVLRTSNALAERFGVTQTKALEKIEEGYAKGGRQADDYLKQLREFNAELKAGGQNLDEFVGTTLSGTKEGIFDDKLPDALREFTKEIQEQRKPVQEALTNAFGEEFAGRIKEEIESGSITAMDALEDISRKLNEVGPNIQAKRELLEALFKGPGEAIGTGLLDNLDEITKSLSEQNDEYSDLQKHQQEMVDQYDELSQEQQKFERQTMKFGNNFEKMWVDIRTSAWEALNSINKGITEMTGSFDERVSAGTTERLNEEQELRNERKQDRFSKFKGSDPIDLASSLGVDIGGGKSVKGAFKDHIDQLRDRRKKVLEEIDQQELMREASEPTGGYGLALDETINSFLPEGHKVGDPFGLGPNDEQKDDKKAKRAQRIGGEIDALKKFLKNMDNDGGGGGGEPPPDPGPGSDPSPDPDQETEDKTPTTSVKARAPKNFHIEIQELGNDMKIVPQTLEEGGEEVQDLILNAMLSAVNSLQTSQDSQS